MNVLYKTLEPLQLKFLIKLDKFLSQPDQLIVSSDYFRNKVKAIIKRNRYLKKDTETLNTWLDWYNRDTNNTRIYTNEVYNKEEMAHIAGNYAINCLKGYDGSFDNWFNGISPHWRKIANRKITK